MALRPSLGRPALLLGAVLALAALLAPSPARAAHPVADALTDPGGQVRWQGMRFSGPASPPRPETCAIAECDVFRLRVGLPAGTFARPGAVQVGIRWRDEAKDLDLFVYDAEGALAAKSDGVFASTAESVNLDRPRNGVYRVVVVPRFTNGETMTYEGQAQVERPPAARPVRDLLPNLVALDPRNIHFAIGAYLFDPETPLGEASSCYPEEMIEQGARRCMRFDQVIGNTGRGPFELRYRMEGLATDQQLRQRIYRSDGSFHDRVADTYEFHAAHAHFHYKNFAQSHLWRTNGDGDKIGGAPVRTGDKNGFCMIDVENIWYGLLGDGPRTYYFPRCNAPTEHDSTGTYMTNGITPGWADVYNWFLADQYIEVAGLPDRCYLLETVADPNDTIVESNERDNVTRTMIVLHGDRGRILGDARAADVCG